MTAMSPPSLFLAPHIVEPDPSAILAGIPLVGRARGHMSRWNIQSAEAGPSANLADGPVRGGQRPADLLLRAILGRWQVHCKIIGNRSIT